MAWQVSVTRDSPPRVIVHEVEIVADMGENSLLKGGSSHWICPNKWVRHTRESAFALAIERLESLREQLQLKIEALKKGLEDGASTWSDFA